MIRLSSNFTLFFKIVLPIFFLVLYGLFTIFFLVGDESPLAMSSWFPYSNLIFYLAVLLIMYKTVFKLYRVDCAADHFVVTNYKHAYRYTYDSIESIEETSYFLFTLATLEFKSPSRFGYRISFLVDKPNREKILDAFGQVFPID